CASPVLPIRSWKKSPSVRFEPVSLTLVVPPHWLPMIVSMLPRRMGCSPARIGVVNVTAFAWPLSVCVRYRLHDPPTESGPPSGQAFGPPLTRSTCAAVPYQAMSTRPSSPAAIQPNTLLARPGVGTLTGFDQLAPSFVEYVYMSEVSPALPPLIGA